MVENRNMKGYNSSTFLIGFAVGVVVLFLVGVVSGRDIRYIGENNNNQDTVVLDDLSNVVNIEDDVVATSTVSVSDQMPGDTVHIDQVVLGMDGWAVIHEVEEGRVLNALGATRLDSGNHSDVLVDLLRETNPGGTYVVILYSDNGNKEFEIRADLPVIDTEGNPVMQSFRTYGGAAGR
jgi:hypothetical protein